MQRHDDILRTGDLPRAALEGLLGRYGLDVAMHPDEAPIPGSYWGAPEAGLVGLVVHVRSDTPVHSLLHEGSHIVCMDGRRRDRLDRDAGGDDLEESAVCYLQVLLADCIEGVGRDRLMRDMEAWGYSFRLGSTRRWFEEDAGDARDWLVAHALVTPEGQPTFRLRP